ncbi:MAG: alpha/beta fold hydrolase [Candidatus Handelsmanbacteria bacterium]|nr:alpha/beta fold hydrolase [Candidatus Handelsmanbacteria bacterium]
MSRTEVLLQHGWGFGPCCWAGWRAALPPEGVLRVADRGYFGTPCSPEGQPQVIVAHSFGLYLLEPRWLEGAQLVVGLGSFGTFHPEGEAGRRSRRVVGRMRRRLEEEPESLLAGFWSQCFAPEGGGQDLPGPPEKPLLAADLARLDREALDLELLRGAPRVLLLHGEEDQVVPVEQAQALQRQLSNSRLEVLPGAGHALPLTRPAACWAAIAAALGP